MNESKVEKREEKEQEGKNNNLVVDYQYNFQRFCYLTGCEPGADERNIHFSNDQTFAVDSSLKMNCRCENMVSVNLLVMSECHLFLCL
jgi:hypothetical protein